MACSFSAKSWKSRRLSPCCPLWIAFRSARATCRTSTCCASWASPQAGAAQARHRGHDRRASAVERVHLSGGNYDVILCERGIRTYETATRNTMDISAIPVVKKLTHLPDRGDPRMALAAATWSLRWQPRWPREPTESSSRSIPTPTRPPPTQRRRLYPDQFES